MKLTPARLTNILMYIDNSISVLDTRTTPEGYPSIVVVWEADGEVFDIILDPEQNKVKSVFRLLSTSPREQWELIDLIAVPVEMQLIIYKALSELA